MSCVTYRNLWSCLVDVSAWILGYSPLFIEKVIGHDGSEIVHTNLKEPFCRKSFTVYEIIYAIHKICPYLQILHFDNEMFKKYLKVEKNENWSNLTGILCLPNHAIGILNGQVSEPNLTKSYILKDLQEIILLG